MTKPPKAIGDEATFDEAMRVMEEEGFRHLPVVAGGEVVGVVSDRDLLEATGWLTHHEREVLESPSGSLRTIMHAHPVTVRSTDSVTKSVLRMAGHRIGCVPVVDEGKLVGMLTETDVLAAFVRLRAEGAIPESCDEAVADHMTPDVVTVGPDVSAEEMIVRMQGESLRHLPVLEDGTVVGIVSDRDIRLGVGRGMLDEAVVREFMTGETLTVGPDERVSRAAELMIGAKVGAVPVVREDGALCGIVALPDLFAACLDGFEAMGSGG